jgi:hypothetical protein
MSESCWFAQLSDAGPCDGRLVRCHLLTKQLLARTFPQGAVYVAGYWRAAPRYSDPDRSLVSLLDDPRVWVPGCGGVSGIGGHHGQYDHLQKRIGRSELPAGVEEFAKEFGLQWWLERRYGTQGAP